MRADLGNYSWTSELGASPGQNLRLGLVSLLTFPVPGDIILFHGLI